MAFTALVTDNPYSRRRIVGWRTTDRTPTELALDALEMALWVRDRAGHDVCCDGLPGLPDAIGAAWPKAIVQTCVVHLIRNSMRYARGRTAGVSRRICA